MLRTKPPRNVILGGRVTPQFRTQLKELADREPVAKYGERRSSSSLAGVLLTWSAEQLERAGSLDALLNAKVVPLHKRVKHWTKMQLVLAVWLVVEVLFLRQTTN